MERESQPWDPNASDEKGKGGARASATSVELAKAKANSTHRLVLVDGQPTSVYDLWSPQFMDEVFDTVGGVTVPRDFVPGMRHNTTPTVPCGCKQCMVLAFVFGAVFLTYDSDKGRWLAKKSMDGSGIKCVPESRLLQLAIELGTEERLCDRFKLHRFMALASDKSTDPRFNFGDPFIDP